MERKEERHAAIVVYLVASMAIPLWRARRWTHHRQAAYLIPPLIVAAAGLTIVTIGLIF
jgi:hypothetical protein